MRNLCSYVLFALVLSLASPRLESKNPPGLSGASGHALSSGDLWSREEDSLPDDTLPTGGYYRFLYSGSPDKLRFSFFATDGLKYD